MNKHLNFYPGKYHFDLAYPGIHLVFLNDDDLINTYNCKVKIFVGDNYQFNTNNIASVILQPKETTDPLQQQLEYIAKSIRLTWFSKIFNENIFSKNILLDNAIKWYEYRGKNPSTGESHLREINLKWNNKDKAYELPINNGWGKVEESLQEDILKCIT